MSETVEKQAPQPSPPETSPESFSAEKMLEYQWPPDRTGEFYVLRHQVCQFLEIESLEEKYSGKCSFSFVMSLSQIFQVFHGFDSQYCVVESFSHSGHKLG